MHAAGDIVTIGRATLYLGDCRDILPTLPKVDAVVTDPPYGIGASAGVGKYGRIKVADDLAWDEEAPDLTHITALDVPTIIWGGNYFQLTPSRCFLVWDKGAGFRGRDFAECEQAWCSVDGNARVLSRDPLANRDYAGKVHPTQKPIAVMRWSIEHLGSCETILDPYMGAGTTGVAALQMGRSFIGIERESDYFAEAVRRIREANGDDAGPLFGEAA
jgi:DNA modification methylase